MTPKVIDAGGTKEGDTGIYPAMLYPPIIGAVNKDQPADKAGLKPGDKIIAIDGEPLADFYHGQRIINSSAGKELTLTIDRNGHQFQQKVTPIPSPDPQNSGKGVLGFYPDEEKVIKTERNPIKALGFAVDENRRTIVLTWKAFRQVFAGTRSASDTVAVGRRRQKLRQNPHADDRPDGRGGLAAHDPGNLA